MVQLAVDDMVRLANDLNITTSLDLTNTMLVRKTIAAEHALATVEKALEAAGGAGFYRKARLERLLRDVHAAQFHPLPTKRQQRFRPAAWLSASIPVADLYIRKAHELPCAEPSALEISVPTDWMADWGADPTWATSHQSMCPVILRVSTEGQRGSARVHKA